MRNRRNRFKSNSTDLDLIHIIKRILEILIIICLLIFIFSSINLKNRSSLPKESEISEYQANVNTANISVEDSNVNTNLLNESISSFEKTSESKSTTINMALTGDIMCHNTIYKDAYSSDLDTYDFSYIFDDIKYNIQTADIAIRKFRNNFCRKFCWLQ